MSFLSFKLNWNLMFYIPFERMNIESWRKCGSFEIFQNNIIINELSSNLNSGKNSADFDDSKDAVKNCVTFLEHNGWGWIRPFFCPQNISVSCVGIKSGGLLMIFRGVILRPTPVPPTGMTKYVFGRRRREVRVSVEEPIESCRKNKPSKYHQKSPYPPSSFL